MSGRGLGWAHLQKASTGSVRALGFLVLRLDRKVQDRDLVQLNRVLVYHRYLAAITGADIVLRVCGTTAHDGVASARIRGDVLYEALSYSPRATNIRRA